MLAALRIPLIAYHFPWPGIGHVGTPGRRLPLLPVADAHRAVSCRMGGGLTLPTYDRASPRRSETRDRLREIAMRSAGDGWRMRAFAVAASVLTGAARADAVADFYKGKTITLFVGAGVGGSYDMYARLLAPTLSKHMPGQPDRGGEADPRRRRRLAGGDPHAAHRRRATAPRSA